MTAVETPDAYTQEQMMDDFVLLLKLQQRGLGLEPDHPVVRGVEARVTEDPEQALWYTMLYFAYMHLPSAHLAFQVLPTPEETRWAASDSPVLSLPTGFERRGLRTRANMARHLGEVVLKSLENGLHAWLTAGFTEDPYWNWMTLQNTLTSVYGNGRWAAYNTGEGLMAINGLNVLPGDMGIAGATGPKWGLEMLYGPGRSLAEWEWLGAKLRRDVTARGVPARLDELETNLCDFHSLTKGLHYVGQYPDMLMTQLNRSAERVGEDWATRALQVIWDVRLKEIPRRYLGELGGWFGEDKERLTFYKRTGLIIDRSDV